MNDACRVLLQLESEREYLKKTLEETHVEHTACSTAVYTHQKTLKQKEQEINELKQIITTVEGKIAFFREEIRLPLHGTLTDDEKVELQTLLDRAHTQAEEWSSVQMTYLDISNQYNNYKTNLDDHLRLQRDTIQAKLLALTTTSSSLTTSSTDSQSSTNEERQAMTAEADFLERTIATLEQDIHEVEMSREQAYEQLKASERELETVLQQEQELLSELKEASTRQDKMMNKRMMLIDTIQQKQGQIRELGAVPRKEMLEYQNRSEKELLR